MKKIISLMLSILILAGSFASLSLSVSASYTAPDILNVFSDYITTETSLRASEKITAVNGESIVYSCPEVYITTLYDGKNNVNTEKTRTVLYVINTNTKRVGTESDETIIKDLLQRGFIVILADYQNNPLAVSPMLDWHLQKIRHEINEGTTTYLGSLKTEPYRNYVLPAGCNIALDEVYWSIDKHSADGMLERIVEIWNTDFKAVYGDTTVSYPDGTTKKVSEITAETIFDCVKPDGSFIDMDLKMDIIYPVNPFDKVPVMVQGSSHADRKNVWSPTSVSRCQITGFLFNGYAAVAYDYPFVPMAREDHYGYFDGNNHGITDDNYTYSVGMYNLPYCDTAAIRKVRYLSDYNSDTFKFDPEKIGVMGISKSGVAIRLANPNPEKLPQERYLPGHHGETRYEAGKTTAETVTKNGASLTLRGGEVQPWLTYKDGTPIPSNVQYALTAVGTGTDYLTPGSAPVYVTGTMKYYSGSNGSYWGYYPQVTSKCYQNNIPCLYYENAGIAHEYPRGVDTKYGVDTYDHIFKFADYFLGNANIDVAYVSIKNNSYDISTTEPVTVKFLGQAELSEVQKITIKDQNDNPVNGKWSSTFGDTEWTFTPYDMKGDTDYTLTVPADLKGKNGKTIKAEKRVQFSTVIEIAKSPSAVADKNGTMTAVKTSSSDDGVYVLFSEKASELAASGSARLAFSVKNDAANTVEAYALTNASESNLSSADIGEKVGEVIVCGSGIYSVDVTDYVKTLVDDEKAAFVLKAKKQKETKIINKIDFEDISSNNFTHSFTEGYYNSKAAGGISKEQNATPNGSKSAKVSYHKINTETNYPNRLPWNDGMMFGLFLYDFTCDRDASFTVDDFGRKFNVSAKIYDTSPNGRMIKLRLGTSTFGEVNGSTDKNIDIKNTADCTYFVTPNSWQDVSFDITLNNMQYFDKLQKRDLRIGGETFGNATSASDPMTYAYYIDDVTVTEDITEVEFASETGVLGMAPTLLLGASSVVPVPDTKLPKPKKSMSLNFENATRGTYTGGSTSGTLGKVVKDGGGLKFDMGIDNLADATVEVIKDTTGKFGGKVLKVNPYVTTTTSQVYARLLPETKTTDAKGNECFPVKDENGRLEEGYRMHYSYDYYIDPQSATGSSAYTIYQSLWWRKSTETSTTNRVQEDLLEATKTSHSNIGWSHTVAKTTETASTATIGTRASGWNQSNYPDKIHIDYIFDFETGELWMYRNGELSAKRDFSEVPKSSFKNSSTAYYQDMDIVNNIVLSLRQKGGTNDGKSATYYDNFKIDMYGSDVSALDLRELVTDSKRGEYAGTSLTYKMGFGNKLSLGKGDDATFTYNSTEKSATVSASSAKKGYLKIEPNPSYKSYADITADSKYLPEKPAGNTPNTYSQGVGYLRFGYNKTGDLTEDNKKQYSLYPLEFTDYVSISADINVASTTKGSVYLDTQWYPFDGNSAYQTTDYKIPGKTGAKAITFISFTQSNDTRSISAFGTTVESLTWEKDVTYHVDYVVEFATGKEFVFLNGKKMAERKSSDASINQKGRLARVRAWTSLGGTTETFTVSDFDWSIYNSLYTNISELAASRETTPTDIAKSVTATLADGKVTLNAVPQRFAPHSDYKIYAALYQNYGSSDSVLIDAKELSYVNNSNLINQSFDAGSYSEDMSVVLFMWSTDQKPVVLRQVVAINHQ